MTAVRVAAGLVTYCAVRMLIMFAAMLVVVVIGAVCGDLGRA